MKRRPVHVSGHQESWDGLFHIFITTVTGTFAIVEDEQGNLKYVDPYKIKFTDREK